MFVSKEFSGLLLLLGFFDSLESMFQLILWFICSFQLQVNGDNIQTSKLHPSSKLEEKCSILCAFSFYCPLWWNYKRWVCIVLETKIVTIVVRQFRVMIKPVLLRHLTFRYGYTSTVTNLNKYFASKNYLEAIQNNCLKINVFVHYCKWFAVHWEEGLTSPEWPGFYQFVCCLFV